MSYKKCPTITNGLQDGEIAVELEDGSLVAITREYLRSEVQGAVIAVSARWIDADGKTKLDAQERPVEVSYNHHILQMHMSAHTPDVLSKQVLLLILGEPEETHVLPDGDGAQIPIIGFPDEVRATNSIRQAIGAANHTLTSSDLADIL